MRETVTFQPDCMTADELALWREANGVLTRKADAPCRDCRLEYAARMRAAGRCNGVPGGRGRGIKYHSHEERIAARRASDRAYRLRRAAA